MCYLGEGVGLLHNELKKKSFLSAYRGTVTQHVAKTM